MTDNKVDFFTADQNVEDLAEHAREYLIEPLMPMRDVTLLIGDELRSTVAIQLAASTVCGPDFLSLCAGKGPVVYCSESNTMDTISNWISGFAEEQSLGSYDLKNLHICTLPAGYKTLATKDDKSDHWHASEAWKTLKQKVKEERPALFIFDADFDPEGDAEYADQIVTQMRSMAAEFNLAALLVAQSAKGGAVPQWAESIDTHWIATQMSTDDDPYQPECDLLVRRFRPVETRMELYQSGHSFSYEELPF